VAVGTLPTMTRIDPLLSVSELASSLTDPTHTIVVDARRSREAYVASHLAGARWVDLDHELAGPAADPARGGRHPLPSPAAFARTLSRLGVTPTSSVVVYDDQGGAISAARLWWMLRSLGHVHVRVLDGGWQAIEEAAQRGTLVIDGAMVPDAWSGEGEAPYPVREWTSPKADLAAVDQARTDPSKVVIDVRAPERYRGDVETLDPVAGHVAGAINAPYAESLGADGRFLDASALRARYEPLLEGRPLERAIVHCGSGVTACHTLLALERAGLPGASLYVGSWSEWCRHPERAREPR